MASKHPLPSDVQMWPQSDLLDAEVWGCRIQLIEERAWLTITAAQFALQSERCA